MHPSTPQADQAIVKAADSLNTNMIALADLRRNLAAMRLGLPAAEDRLDHIDDLLAIAKRQLMGASAIMDAAVDRILAEDSARFDHANDDGPIVMDHDAAYDVAEREAEAWREANDNMARLFPRLRGGVL